VLITDWQLPCPVIIIIIIHTFLYCHKVVTSEAVAEQVRLVSVRQVKQMTFKPRFENC